MYRSPPPGSTRSVPRQNVLLQSGQMSTCRNGKQIYRPELPAPFKQITARNESQCVSAVDSCPSHFRMIKRECPIRTTSDWRAKRYVPDCIVSYHSNTCDERRIEQRTVFLSWSYVGVKGGIGKKCMGLRSKHISGQISKSFLIWQARAMSMHTLGHVWLFFLSSSFFLLFFFSL